MDNEVLAIAAVALATGLALSAFLLVVPIILEALEEMADDDLWGVPA